MGLVWTAVGVYGTVLGLVVVLAGVAVFLARPDRLQNRLLATTLLCDGVWNIAGSGAMFLSDHAPTVYAWQALVFYVACLSVGLYLCFLGTLGSPLVRPFATRRARFVVLAGAAATGAVVMHALRASIITIVPGGDLAPWNAIIGEKALVVTALVALCGVFGLVVTVDAWRRAPPGTLARRQAGAYAFAFGIRDAAIVVVFTGILLNPASVFWSILAPPAAVVAFVVALTYAVLRTQLFDIDLRIKFTLKQSTVAAAFVAVFFVASELAQQFLGETLGSTYVGIGAAGLLVFALAPLQRLADRVADQALPRVQATEEYLAFRKMEVYKAALESAALDGVVTDRERAVLATLREKLGISAEVAGAMERDLVPA